MRIGGTILAAAVAVLLTGCSGNDSPAPAPTPSASQVSPAAEPSASPTPASHELVVTVRDEAPLGAYSLTDDGRCTPIDPEFPPVIVVSGPDGEELASAPVPTDTVRDEGGTCAADPVTMTVPYAETYDVSLGVDTEGATDPAAERPTTAVETKGRSQRVTLVG